MIPISIFIILQKQRAGISACELAATEWSTVAVAGNGSSNCNYNSTMASAATFSHNWQSWCDFPLQHLHGAASSLHFMDGSHCKTMMTMTLCTMRPADHPGKGPHQPSRWQHLTGLPPEASSFLWGMPQPTGKHQGKHHWQDQHAQSTAAEWKFLQ